MAISPQRLTIFLYSAHRAVIFAIAQISRYCICLSVCHCNCVLPVWRINFIYAFSLFDCCLNTDDFSSHKALVIISAIVIVFLLAFVLMVFSGRVQSASGLQNCLAGNAGDCIRCIVFHKICLFVQHTISKPTVTSSSCTTTQWPIV